MGSVKNQEASLSTSRPWPARDAFATTVSTDQKHILTLTTSVPGCLSCIDLSPVGYWDLKLKFEFARLKKAYFPFT